jgi:hypothetical protein
MKEQVRQRLLELRRAKHEELYLSYVNDFLTVVEWAEYYGLNEEQSSMILEQFVEVA